MDDEKNFPHARDLRKGRVSLPGHIYLITTVCVGRQSLFHDFWLARQVIGCLKNSDKMKRTDTLAFVLMPDHLHWLFQLGDVLPLSRIVGDFKSVSAHYSGRRLWQSGFHDHALRQEEGLRHMARYVVANPLRAGLVEDIGHYPHWWAKWL